MQYNLEHQLEFRHYLKGWCFNKSVINLIYLSPDKFKIKVSIKRRKNRFIIMLNIQIPLNSYMLEWKLSTSNSKLTGYKLSL